MKPTKPEIKNTQHDLFRSQLINIMDPMHSMVKLSKNMNWDELPKAVEVADGIFLLFIPWKPALHRVCSGLLAPGNNRFFKID